MPIFGLEFLGLDNFDCHEPPVKIDFSSESGTLFIAFGSLRLDRKVPPFEYVHTFSNLPVKKMLIRDLHKIFYLRGLPGISQDILGTRDYLLSIIEQTSVNRVVIFGGSAGGFAALLYGWFLRADEVHTFSPITLLPTRRGWAWLQLVARRSWGLLVRNLWIRFNSRLPRAYLDLQQVLSQDNKKTKYFIYYGRNHPPDVIRSGRMANLPGVHLKEYDFDTHHIDRHLQAIGEWDSIFCDANG